MLPILASLLRALRVATPELLLSSSAVTENLRPDRHPILKPRSVTTEHHLRFADATTNACSRPVLLLLLLLLPLLLPLLQSPLLLLLLLLRLPLFLRFLLLHCCVSPILVVGTGVDTGALLAYVSKHA